MRTRILVLAFLWLAVPAAAASRDDWRACESDDPVVSEDGCSRVIAAEPNAKGITIAYYNRALAKSARHDVDGAFADYSSAIVMEPNNDFALHNRAMIYDDRGEYDKALADFNTAVALNPIGGHFYNRGRVYYHAARFREAADDFTTTLHLWPTGRYGAFVLAYRCRALAARDTDLADARADCDHAVSSDPANPDMLIARAMVRLRQDDPVGAIADATAALGLPPPPVGGPFSDIGPADARFLRGLAELKLAQKRTERRDQESAAKLFKAGAADLDAAAAADPKLAARYAEAGIVR